MDARTQKFNMKIYNNFKEKFGENFYKNVNLSNYSWFNLGGNADYLYKAKDKKQLKEFLFEAKNQNLNITILGAGSNTLFRDNGVRGAVIKLGQNFSFTKLIDENTLEVGAATLDRKVANFAKENNLSGLEFLSCIPGSIGGSIKMNSGCYGYNISGILKSITAIDIMNMNEVEIKKKDINFLYRGTDLSKNLIIISSKLVGLTSKRENIEKKQIELIDRKKKSQPSQVKTCGSTFKNISENKKAWMLIKDAGCDNLREGDASISEKHCNFFVNNGSAKSTDIENLIKKVKKKVYERTGVNLELEIKII